ncbi:hypothetical protein BLNAU_7036 [Blattamonas nauphoetae]|uniref:Uncharacterized protein n=1 Tax=Blattamonas nauphoetae TaxID=2049346 RepID=A0ABQ9Y2C0_9EUKA|nr:hypothetical protein BLNAU_7036 [Blattamonas nauphoetae]
MRRSCFCALVPFLLFMPLDLAFVRTLSLTPSLSLQPPLETCRQTARSSLGSSRSSRGARFSLKYRPNLCLPSFILSSTPLCPHPLQHCQWEQDHDCKERRLPTLVRLLSRSPILSLPPLIPQNALTTLWNCARNEEIKDISRSVGAIDTLLDASIRSEVDLQTIETTLGALLSLTVNAENKSYVREHNGLPLLVSGLARFQITPHTPQHIPVLHTALTTPRNCCSNGVLLAALSPHAPPSVTKEAVLLVKNLTLVDQNKKESLQPNLDSSSRKKVRAHFQEPTVDELLGILVGDADRWCGGTFGRNDVEILFRKALSERSCSTLERATDVISLYLNKALICS